MPHGTQSSNNHDFHDKSGYENSKRLMITGFGAITLAGLYYYFKKNIPTVWAHESKENEVNTVAREPGSFVEGLPVYSSDDVAKHCNESTGVWISYKSGVYDITPFIKIHPGTLLHVICFDLCSSFEIFQEEIRFYLELGAQLSLSGLSMQSISNLEPWLSWKNTELAI